MNPWEPFHVERGFRPGDSTVTAFSCESQIEVAEYFNTDPVVILRMFVAYGEQCRCRDRRGIGRRTHRVSTIFSSCARNMRTTSAKAWAT